MTDTFETPPSIDRVSIHVLPRQALLDWLNTLPFDGEDTRLEELRENGVVYLVPFSDEEAEVIIEWHFERIFERELYAWCPDAEHHPEDQSWEAFHRMFDVRVDYMVFDLDGDALEVED